MRPQNTDSRIKHLAYTLVWSVFCLPGTITSGEDFPSPDPNSANTSTAAETATRPITANFRVTIKIFEEKNESPVAEHLVLFHNAMVYDFDQVNRNVVTVIDPERKRIVLLDRNSQKRAQINTDDLISIAARIRASTTDPKLQDRLGMNATVDFDKETQQYSVEFDRTQYATSIQQPNQPSITRQFAQFADWALRLNIARKRGMPPFARMSMNQRVAADGFMPNVLELQLKSGLKTKRFRSTHELIETLSESDRKKLDDVGGMLALYKEAPVSEIP